MARLAQTLSPIGRLDNPIRRYPWGSRTAIAELQGRPVPSAEPEAELWMGSHPLDPSRILLDGAWRRLDEVVRLPFLLKFLAAVKPLSIQAHPDREQARDGFRREEAAGVPRGAPQRSYRDDRPKPELIYALTPFAMLRGFRPVAKMGDLAGRLGWAEILPQAAELDPRRPAETVRALYLALMELAQDDVAALVARTLSRRAALDAVLGEWIARLAAEFPGDRGALAPVLLNLFELRPGEAIFTPPGTLHAYLEGVGVELMASSDNVLRGGLTSKVCNVPELLSIVRFEPEPPRLAVAERIGAGEERFTSPDGELVLSALRLEPGRTLERGADHGVEIALCLEGSGTVAAAGGRQSFARGDAFLVAADAGAYRLAGEGRLMRAASGPG